MASVQRAVAASETIPAVQKSLQEKIAAMCHFLKSRPAKLNSFIWRHHATQIADGVNDGNKLYPKERNFGNDEPLVSPLFNVEESDIIEN